MATVLGAISCPVIYSLGLCNSIVICCLQSTSFLYASLLRRPVSSEVSNFLISITSRSRRLFVSNLLHYFFFFALSIIFQLYFYENSMADSNHQDLKWLSVSSVFNFLVLLLSADPLPSSVQERFRSAFRFFPALHFIFVFFPIFPP